MAAGPSGSTGWSNYRVILYLVLGLVLVECFVASYRPVWRAYDPNEYRERVKNCRRQAHDLVLIGGSPVAEGLDPTVLRGLRWRGTPLERTYNLGLPGATTSEIWHAVEHGLPTPPRLLIYGITASDLNDARDEPQGPRSLMDLEDVAAWRRYRPERAIWCVRQVCWERLDRLWGLWHYRNGIRLWAADQVARLCPTAFPEAAAEARRGLERSATLHREDGYAPDPDAQVRGLDQLKAAGTLGQPFHFLENYRLGGHLGYLHHLLDWAEQHQVAVILVDMPVSADLEERMHPQEFATYRTALHDLQRQRGVEVLDASRTVLGLSDADFADLIHLNAHGAARLSAWLRLQLDEMVNLEYPR
jgi:hypothetical protein